MSPARRETLRKVFGTFVLVLAAVFLLAGLRRSVKAYDPTTADIGFLTYQKVGERQLVEDATFGGVNRRDGKLYSTYDRSAPKQGKRSCPT